MGFAYGKRKVMELSPLSKISDVLNNIKGAEKVFTELGYKCVDCAVNIEDTLIIAAKYHKKDLNELLEKLRTLTNHEGNQNESKNNQSSCE
jgi:hypothetical protein